MTEAERIAIDFAIHEHKKNGEPSRIELERAIDLQNKFDWCNFMPPVDDFEMKF